MAIPSFTQPTTPPLSFPTPPPPPKPRRGIPALAVIALCLASGLAGGALVRLTLPDRATVQTATLAPEATATTSARAPAPRGSVTAVAQAAKPSVVTIDNGAGRGTGVIVSSDGEIITNAHVVAGARQVVVRLADGTELQGSVVGSDSDVDIALVEVDRKGLPSARIGSALTLRPGDQVVAVGSPLGLEGSVSSGVVSALGRYVPEESGGIRAAIQTDAAINPGNSGGALLDMNGSLVGITAAKAGGTSIENIGFAIPIDVARAIARDLGAGRRPSHPYLGIGGTEVDEATAQALGSEPGALIDEVGSGTPASAAGLRRGDRIVAIDEVEIRSFFHLSVTLATRRAGDVVTLKLGGGRTVQVTLAERPA